MSGLSKDELGFVRAHGYGRTSRAELGKLLKVETDEDLYVSSINKGVRTSKLVNQKDNIQIKSGDTFSVGPRVTKASLFSSLLNPEHKATKPRSQNHVGSKTEQRLRQEIAGLKRAGYGWVEPAQKTEWGWMVRLKGVILPNGVRTDAMVLLPDNYPLVSPIGFYVKQGAETANLDTSHLFENRAYHGALDLSEHGWRWFCGIAQGWKPGKHTLVSYINIVFMLFNDQRG
ncbi:MAG: hypothetical protein ACKN9F_05920 [Methylomonas sp.]